MMQKATAGPSTALCFAQDDSLLGDTGKTAAMDKTTPMPGSVFSFEVAEIQEDTPGEQALQLLDEPGLTEEMEDEIDLDKPDNVEFADPQSQILALYDEYRPRLFRYLHSLNLERDPAEEIIQETFMRLAIELPKKDGMENVQGWIVRVAHNLAMKALKDSKRDAANSDNSLVLKNYADPRLSPEEAFSKEERIRQMEAALANFSPVSRQCFQMRAQGFRYRDIALAQGISEQRVAFVVKQATMRLAAICG
jgi:RNA polymerase sigma-70 factor (ECF subfamily)